STIMDKDYESRKEILIAEISGKFETVLSQLNELNRSIEESIAIGRDFENVSSLWTNI
ncbi:hypothetical protein CANCADRAFT_19183, partial [Tortispora caseinolytica NRRL Y-17796]